MDLQNNNINPLDFYEKMSYIKHRTQGRWGSKLTKIAFLKYQSPLIWQHMIGLYFFGLLQSTFDIFTIDNKIIYLDLQKSK